MTPSMMNPSMTTPSRTGLRRTAVAALAAVLVLGACGGGGDGDPAGAGDAGDVADAVQLPEVADAVAVDAAADVATNLLPDLVVDNLNDDNKVNLRNYGVGDKPILLWMWAPH